MPNYTTLDNTKLYYEMEGKGQPVVFIHGWSCSHETMAGLVENMKQDYCCVSYSHRGHGSSELAEQGYILPQLARDLKELIGYLGLKDVILVGHSMGGYTIYEYVKQFGCENISKAVIIDMSPKVICDEKWKGGAFGTYDADDLREDMEQISLDITQFMMKFWRLVLPDFAKLPKEMDLLVAPGLKGVNHTLPLLGLWHSMFTREYRDVLPAVKVPTAYVIPDYPIYPMLAAEYVKDHVSGPAEIIKAPGTHMCLIEHPAEVASSIKAFLKK